ncbi:MAG: hypothetical protein V7634_2128, partial [Bradyrhizobium sp.]
RRGSKDHPYTPVVELIVNAIQAIRTVKPTGGLIQVSIVRNDQADMIDKIAPVDAFIVRDDGIRFTEEHRNSFTLYTALKAGDGGKGFGRFTCLKYFSRLTVESVFADGSTRKKRSFAMGHGNDIMLDEKVTDGLGYFRWHGNIKLYIEVLSWTKVQRDAEMRNKVFFHKFGI